MGDHADAAAAGPGERWAGAGRWVEADVAVPGLAGPLTVVSTHVQTGEAGTPRQEEEQDLLDAVTARLGALRERGTTALLTGDVDAAHTEADIANRRGSRGRAGSLPQERAHLDAWAAAGWVDVVRALHPGVERGPCTWWSWRGQAFDRDAWWRIDHQVATPDLAAPAVEAVVDRAPSDAERSSDHAPVVVRHGEPGSAPGRVA